MQASLPPPALSETPTWPVGACPEELLLVPFHISSLATCCDYCENSKLLCQMLQHWKVVHFHFSVQLVILFRTKLIRHKWFSINLILPIVFRLFSSNPYILVCFDALSLHQPFKQSLKYCNSDYLYIISMSTLLLH